MAPIDEIIPVFSVLGLLVLFFFWRIVPIPKRIDGDADEPPEIEPQREAPAVVSIVTFFGLARTNAPASDTHIIIDRCEGCRSKFDPPRLAAGEYVADDLMQHFCAPECCDRIVELCLPFYYHRGRNASHDPAFTRYLMEHYGDGYPGLEQVVKTEVRKWDKKRKEDTQKVANNLRETIRERYQRKAGLEVQPRPRSDVSGVTFTGSERINPPADGGCRRGYCYACARRIPINYDVRKSFPVLPRGDTYWFCSLFCYTRTLRAWVPFGWRYEGDDETPGHREERQAYFRDAEPKLLAYLENVESEEEKYQLIVPEWIPSSDPPIIRTIKKPTADRCLKCGTAEKSERADPVPDTPFWYCSDECSREATEE